LKKSKNALIISFKIALRVFVSAGIVLTLCLFSFCKLEAQSKDGLRYDIEIWTALGVKKELLKNFSVQLDYAHRFQDTLKAVKTRFFNVGVEYKLSDEIEIGLTYRLFLKDENGFAAKRWMPQISFEPQIGRWRFRCRSRLDIENNEEGNWQKAWRNQFRFKYKPKSFFITPSLSYELFYGVGIVQAGSYKNRLMFSLEMELTKRQEIELEIGAQQEWNVRKPQFDEIFSISYQFDF
jgi:hypothetical protein